MELIFNWPQITVIALIFLGIVSRVVRLNKDGLEGVDAAAGAFGVAVYPILWCWLLYSGGFFTA